MDNFSEEIQNQRLMLNIQELLSSLLLSSWSADSSMIDRSPDFNDMLLSTGSKDTFDLTLQRMLLMEPWCPCRMKSDSVFGSLIRGQMYSPWSSDPTTDANSSSPPAKNQLFLPILLLLYTALMKWIPCSFASRGSSNEKGTYTIKGSFISRQGSRVPYLLNLALNL